MLAGIAPSDRKILLIGGTLLLLLLTASVVLAPPGGENNSIPSSYSAQPGGAEAAYLLLSQLHYSVRRWENSPTELEAIPKRALVILAEPFQRPSEKEKKRGFWGHPKPRQGDPCTPWGGVLPLS